MPRQGVPVARGGVEYGVYAVVFFGRREVARFPTREQAEWFAREREMEAERHPRGPVLYVVAPVGEGRRWWRW